MSVSRVEDFTEKNTVQKQNNGEKRSWKDYTAVTCTFDFKKHISQKSSMHLLFFFVKRISMEDTPITHSNNAERLLKRKIQ